MNKRTITYLPGNHPTPMLAYFTEKNENIFLEDKELVFGEFTNKYEHYFNIGSYLIIDKENNEIKSYSINNFPNFLYLLRIIHLELNFKFEHKFLHMYQKNLNNLRDEFKIN